MGLVALNGKREIKIYECCRNKQEEREGWRREGWRWEGGMKKMAEKTDIVRAKWA